MDEEIIGILFTLAANAVLYAIGLSIYSCVKKTRRKRYRRPKSLNKILYSTRFPVS